MIQYIICRTILHATESESKVEKAFRFVTGGETITKTMAEGYYGNPIIVFETTLKKKDEIDKFLRGLKGLLSDTEIQNRVDDDCVLHLRFDKQKAFANILQIGEGGDVITAKLKISCYPKNKKNAIEVAKRLLVEIT